VQVAVAWPSAERAAAGPPAGQASGPATHDGSPVFVQWRSIERTLDGLGRTRAATGGGSGGGPALADAYRRYLKEALPAARLMLAVQGSPATTPAMVAVDWLDGVPAAAKLRAHWAGKPQRDGYESKLDAVLSSLPVPRPVSELPEDLLPAASRSVPTTVISPSPGRQIEAAARLRDGLVAGSPMFLLNTPSVRDPSMRPADGSHVLSLEVLWTPYSLRGGWAGSSEPWRWLERLATLCEPGLLDSLLDWRVMTPPDYEREFSLARGYAPSFPGGAVAALTARQPELSRYRTPVRGLYLTGAGTFPGAGVWGASGRNTAAVVLAAS
jgi:hypothetical protein